MSETNVTEPSVEPSPTPPIEPTVEPTTEPTSTTEPPKTEEPKEEPTPEFVPLTADDIVIPEGMEVAEDLRDEFLGIVNNQELDPKERVNQMIGLYGKALTAASETNSKAWADLQSEWQSKVKADPEIGGAKFDATINKIGKLVEEFGSDELRGAMDMTGAGNNPAIIKFLATLADKLTEGSFTSGNPTNGDGSAASRMFPSMKG